MLTKLFTLFPVDSRSFQSYKYMKFKQRLGSGYILVFLDSYSTTASIKRNYIATSFQQTQKDSYTMSRAVPSNLLTVHLSNLVQRSIKGVPAIQSVHTLSRSHKSEYNSVKGSNLLRKVLLQTLYLSSSAARNIVDSSDSSPQPNILKRLYQKVMPEKLRLPKNTLRIGGATLSACCTHKVSIL